jgi:hypothetical protein
VLAVACALLAAHPAPATAADDDHLTGADLGPGWCEPEVVLTGQTTDCRFPLLREAVLDSWAGPHVADVNTAYRADPQPDCVVESGHLVCRGIPADYYAGTFTVTPVVSYERAAATATFRVLEAWRQPVSISPVGGGEQLVLPDRPLLAWVDGTERTEPAYLTIRSRDGGPLSWTMHVPEIDRESYDAVEIDVGTLPPGRYRATPCLGEQAVDCAEVPGGFTFQVGTGGLREAVAGWNRVDADRINLVIAGSGFEDADAVAAMADLLLGVGGPLLMTWEDEVLDPDSDQEDVDLVVFGPFAMEPLRSAIDRFNIWVLEDVLADPRALFHTGFRPEGTAGIDLPDVHVTTLHLLAAGQWTRSEAEWPSFTGGEPGDPVRDDLVFAGSYVALPFDAEVWEAPTVTHELGHALFDLRDEYEEADRGVTHGYPNCAPDRETAEEWWGDAVGEVDPWVEEYVEILERYGQWVPETLTEDVTVGFHEGGCYGVEPEDAVRPTADSMMKSQLPVFGTVNRRRIEEILSEWTGLAPFTSAADLSITCEPLRAGALRAVCGVTLAPYVEPPPGGLYLTVGPVRVSCPVETNATGAGARFACTAAALSGAGPWRVAVGGASGPEVAVTLLPPPEPIPPAPLPPNEVPVSAAENVFDLGATIAAAWHGA